MHSWGRASALRLSALVPPTLRGFFPIVRFGLQHNKNLLLLYTVENRGADFAICSRYLQSITLHPPVPAFPICFCSRLVEIMALSSPIGCRSNRSHSCVAHFSVSFPHYTTFPSIGTASKLALAANDHIGALEEIHEQGTGEHDPQIFFCIGQDVVTGSGQG